MTLRFDVTPIADPPGADWEGLAAQRGARRPDAALTAACVTDGAAADNVNRLFDGDAVCVTTGQQPGLLTGPLFTLYKALSAVALARRLAARLDRPVIPVFWVAGDDHDFAEANHVHLLTAANEVRRLTLRERDSAAPLVPLYREPVGPEIGQVLDALEADTPETEFRADILAWVRRHYRPERDMATAFADAVAELLAPLGLVVFRVTHGAAKRVMAPLLVRTLAEGAALDKALAARAASLERDGQPVPVPVGDGATTVMLEGRLGRDRLVLDGGAYVARRSGERFTLAELEAIAAREPRRLSPNVLLRPVVEAALLPTLAYVAGPGELAYLPQTAPLYEALDVPPQHPVARWSARIIEARVAKVLDKYALAPDDLAQPEGRLEASLVRDAMPGDADQALAALRRAIGSEYERLRRAAAALDPTLGKPIQSAKNTSLQNVEHVEKRIVAHLKKHNEIVTQQIAKARHSLFPLGRPQERVFNAVPYLVRYGRGFLDQALAACEAWAAVEPGSPRASPARGSRAAGA